MGDGAAGQPPEATGEGPSWPDRPSGARRLGRMSEFPADRGTTFRLDAYELAVWRFADGTVRVIDNTCLHVGGPLAEGFVERGCVTCPWHGWTYDLATGLRLTVDGAVPGVRSYRAWVDGEDLWVELPVEGGGG